MPPKKTKTMPERSQSVIPAEGPLTLEQARSLVAEPKVKQSVRSAATKRGLTASTVGIAPVKLTLAEAGKQRLAFSKQQDEERARRIREYSRVMSLLKNRGVKGLRRHGLAGVAAATAAPLQILAEGDSWFDYPVPLFGGGVIPRLERLLGVPILNLAKAGDEVRFMLGVEERKILSHQLQQGNPAGGPWDVLLFSGGGNDIVDNPMALWIRDFDPQLPAAAHLIQPRFDAALALVRAGYEDAIAFRDRFSPKTHLVFHTYDFAIPDGRGICFQGPWLRPAFDSHGFPKTGTVARDVVRTMLTQFAAMLAGLETDNVTVINGQGTLSPVPASWHNELHPSSTGFDKFAKLFRTKLKALFPGRVL
jgi:hypothetical protein